MGEREHISEALYHYTIAGLFRTVAVCRIKAGEDVVARARLRRKLNEEGGEEVAAVLFIKAPKVKIEVRHQG